jgi:DNA-binding XRE family transcriptional regulator
VRTTNELLAVQKELELKLSNFSNLHLQIEQKEADVLQLKQEDLAELSGITEKTIYLLENGKGNPSFSTMQKMLTVLGMEMNVEVKKTIE